MSLYKYNKIILYIWHISTGGAVGSHRPMLYPSRYQAQWEHCSHSRKTGPYTQTIYKAESKGGMTSILKAPHTQQMDKGTIHKKNRDTPKS